MNSRRPRRRGDTSLKRYSKEEREEEEEEEEEEVCDGDPDFIPSTCKKRRLQK